MQKRPTVYILIAIIAINLLISILFTGCKAKQPKGKNQNVRLVFGNYVKNMNI